MVIPDCDLPEPAFDQLFIKLGQLVALLPDKILQLLDALHLDGLSGFIGIGLLLQFTQMENLLGNIIIGFPVIGTVQQFLLENQQPFRNAVFLGRSIIPQHKHQVLLELFLVCSLRTQHFVQGFQNDLFQFFFIDCPCIADLTTLFQPAGTPPDNGTAAVVIPVDTLEHLTAITADHHLRKAVRAAVHPLFTSGACLHIPAAYQFFLHLHVEFLGDNGLMVIFYIILRCDAVIERENCHKEKDENAKQTQCPKEKEDAIVEA